MPELPEVEVVRAGLAARVPERRITEIWVDGRPRVELKAERLAPPLLGSAFTGVRRRGKLLWLPYRNHADRSAVAEWALVAHLGMSGQLLFCKNYCPAEPSSSESGPPKYLRAALSLADRAEGKSAVFFADMRRFGFMRLEKLACPPVAGGAAVSEPVPMTGLGIAPDPLEVDFDLERLLLRLSGVRRSIKQVLLDQRLISGIGNIYAAEGLWQAQIHPETPAAVLSREQLLGLFCQLRQLLRLAVAFGGTSFDRQYVNAVGESGDYVRHARVFGREGQACYRCADQLVKIRQQGRGTVYCPRCQKRQIAG